ncbi:MAG: response regulator [Steroidobacteraceae bacterium]
MSTNRALIVDDSRSARHILSRMLESFGLEVDTVESAELALTYLQTARPDVIFMDHLMSGMDGFAAVRVIKANPDTATIPVLMYTSQEGEMYLSQARALGAMGVLPKTLKHADVADALAQLNLNIPTVAQAARGGLPAAAPVYATAEPVRNEPAVANNEVVLENAAMSSQSIPQLAHRIAAEVQSEIARAYPADPEAVRPWRVWALAASGAVLVLLAVVIYQQQEMRQQLLQLQTAQQLLSTRLQSQPEVAEPVAVAAAPAPVLPPVVTPAKTVASATLVASEAVPYGEVPLAGARLERLRTVLDGLRSEQVKGVLKVESFLGDFCLNGTPVAGYMPAADEVLVSRCDVVGNPFGDALGMQQRQSVAFANLVASVNSAAGSIKIQLVDGAHKTAVAYPTSSSTLNAATWNGIAERNQRVEYTVLAP